MSEKPSLKKIELSKFLSNKTGYSLQFSQKLINNLLEAFNINIKNGYLIIKKLGTFKIVNKKERIGRNPKTKETFIIDSRKAISFVCSKKLTKKLNEQIN